MKLAAKFLSWLGLAITLLAPLFVWWGWTDGEQLALVMVIGMVLWFASAPYWIRPEERG